MDDRVKEEKVARSVSAHKSMMRMGLIHLQAPLFKKGAVYKATSVMNMLKHFPEYIRTEMLCAISGTGEFNPNYHIHEVDLSGMEIVQLPAWRSAFDLYLIKLPALMLHILREFRTRSLHWNIVFLVDCLPVTFLCYLLARYYKKQVVLYIRGDQEKELLAKKRRGRKRLFIWLYVRLYRVMLTLLLRNSIGVVAGKELYERYNKKGHVLYRFTATGISRETLSSGPRTDRRDHDAMFRVIYVGNLVSYKGGDVLLRAIEGLRARNVRCHLEIIGTGNEEIILQSLADDFSLKDAVSFRGWVPFGEELFALYRAAHVYVLPSYTEGSPKTVPEAMAFGLPIVASRVGGVPGLIDDGVNGFLVPAGDANALMEALYRLAKDKILWRRMAKAAYAKAGEYTIERQLSQLTEFIRAKTQQVNNKDEQTSKGRE